MKLRTRLFLWVGSLFFLFFIVAYLVEAVLFRKNIGRVEDSLRVEIEEGNLERNAHFEEFLGIVIADLQGKVDSLLYRLEEYSFLKNKFIPSKENQEHMTWTASSELLVVNKWVDFIQSTINGKVSSLVVPNPLDLRRVQRIWIDEDLSWIERSIDGKKHIYFGLRISSNVLRMIADASVNLEFQEQPSLYYFFDWRELLDREPLAESGLHTEDMHGPLAIFDKTFRAKYNKALMYLKKHRNELQHKSSEELKEWIVSQKYRKSKSMLRKLVKPKLYDGKKKDMARKIIQDTFEDSFEYHLNQDRIDMMIWGFSPLWRSELLGTGPLEVGAPLGIATIQGDSYSGEALFSDEVFFKKKIFQDKDYSDRTENSKGNLLASSIALIFNPMNEILYFGNTLKFRNQGQEGFLTIGVNIDKMIQQLAVTTNQKAVLSYQGRMISVYDENGNKVDKSALQLPVSEMQERKSGIFKLQGQKYYFANLQPFHEIDLHFYIYEPSSEAFRFLHFLRDSTKSVIRKISFNMRIIALIALLIGLFLLHNISKRIIRPIALLAKATSSVGAGDFDKVELPSVPEGRHDEIVSLVHSFSQMLQGLKDREKVRGVLNKYVSKEIAEEILKGDVHLGGEERVVSILFADIRSFTKMTESMEPHQVVDMLNGCMTKATKVIDEAGGVIDKYVGDEAMALFGAPIPHSDSALRAIYAGLKIAEEMKRWNEERGQENLPKIEFGVGIHTGNVLVGNMGAENRLNYTVLGSNVNLAARLCAFAGSSEVLITEETLKAEHVEEMVEVEKLEAHQFKGFTHETSVYRVLRFKDSNFHIDQAPYKQE